MKSQRARFVTLASLTVFALAVAFAQEEPSERSARQDNTAVNQRDRDRAEPTADRQKENRSDRDIIQEIRKAVVNDKSLSTYAHNVKIISENGTVTLKGPVRSQDERSAVEQKAAEVAGASNVKNEITIQPEDNSQKQ